MGFRLFSRTEDQEIASIGSGKSVRRQRTGCGGADPGDLTGVKDTHGRSGLGIEQHHDALVRGE